MVRSESFGKDKVLAEMKSAGDKSLFVSTEESYRHHREEYLAQRKELPGQAKKQADNQQLPEILIQHDLAKAVSDAPVHSPKLDAQGRVNEINYPDGKTRSFAYDRTTGHLVKYKDKNGHEWKWDHGNPTRWERTDGKDVLLGRMIVGKDGSFKFLNYNKNYVSHYDANGDEKKDAQRDLSTYSAKEKNEFKKKANEFATTGKPQLDLKDSGDATSADSLYRQGIEQQKQRVTELMNEYKSQGAIGKSFDLLKSLYGGRRDSANPLENAWSHLLNRDESALSLIQDAANRANELATVKQNIDAGQTKDVARNLDKLSKEAKENVATYSESQKAGVDAIATNVAIATATGVAATGYGAIGTGLTGGLTKSLVMAIDGRYQKNLGDGAQNFATGSLSGATALFGGKLGSAAIGKVGQAMGLKVVAQGAEKTISTAGETVAKKIAGRALNDGLKPAITFGAASAAERSALEATGAASDIAAGKDPHLSDRAAHVVEQTVLSAATGIGLHNGAKAAGKTFKASADFINKKRESLVGDTAFDSLRSLSRSKTDKVSESGETAIKSVRGEVMPKESAKPDILSKLIDHSRKAAPEEQLSPKREVLSKLVDHSRKELSKQEGAPKRDQLSKLIDHAPKTMPEVKMRPFDPRPFNPVTKKPIDLKRSPKETVEVKPEVKQEMPEVKMRPFDPRPFNPVTKKPIDLKQSPKETMEVKPEVKQELTEIGKKKPESIGSSGSAMKPFELRDKRSGEILSEGEYRSLKEAVEDAVRRKIQLHGVDLSGADLAGVNLKGVNLAEVNLRGANLRGANLRETNLYHAELDSADLSGAKLEHSAMESAKFSNANLEGANLEGSHLKAVRMNGANLSNSVLKGTNLEGASLIDADLTGANLRGAHLKGANLSNTNFSSTNLKNVDFKDVKSLERSNLDWEQLDPRLHNLDAMNIDWRPLQTLPEDYYSF